VRRKGKMTIAEVIEKMKFSDVIAVLALMLSGASVLWNIYKDILLKPKLKVKVQISVLLQPETTQKEPFIDTTSTNHGPGALTCESIFAKRRGFFRRYRPKYLYVIRDYMNPLSAQLPKKLEVGDRMTLLFHHREKAFLARKPTHVGIRDSFGRIHWADRSSVKQAVSEYLRDFPEVEWKSKSE
jgi:hypothetical protein